MSEKKYSINDFFGSQEATSLRAAERNAILKEKVKQRLNEYRATLISMGQLKSGEKLTMQDAVLALQTVNKEIKSGKQANAFLRTVWGMSTNVNEILKAMDEQEGAE